jgi:4-amino-4-deoxy-L-arabinose transferase-like glycosyltransferase
MLSYQLFGVHDWAARLVPSIAGFLTVLITYCWGRRTVGRRAALAGAVILCLSARFIYYGRMVTMDPVLTLCITSALATAHVALIGGRSSRDGHSGPLAWSWWLISASACALGILTKGPVAFALIVVPVFVVQLLDQRLTRPRWSAWMVYIVVSMGISMPWFAAIAIREGEFATYFFWRHNVMRFVAPFDHEGPFWYYLPGLLLGLLPWTLLLPGLVWYIGNRSLRIARRRPSALGLYLVAFLWCFLFFSAAGCKRPGYILPALSPLALSLGCYLAAIVPLRRWQLSAQEYVSRYSTLPMRVTAFVLTSSVVIAMVVCGMELLTPVYALVVIGMACLSGAILVWLCRRMQPIQAWHLCGVVTFAALFAGVYLLLPANARRFSLRGQIRPLAQTNTNAALPVACFPHAWDSVGFYMPGHPVRIYGAEERSRLFDDLQNKPGTLVVAKAGDEFAALLKEMPAGLEFVPHGRKGYWEVGQIRPRESSPEMLYASHSNDFP